MYFGNWTKYEEMVHDFTKSRWEDSSKQVPETMPPPENVLFASYTTGSYDGCATVLFKQEDKIYEVYGSHCSCNGLEECWEPDEVTWEALALRIPEILDTGNDPYRDSYRGVGTTEARIYLVDLIESNLSYSEQQNRAMAKYKASTDPEEQTKLEAKMVYLDEMLEKNT